MAEVAKRGRTIRQATLCVVLANAQDARDAAVVQEAQSLSVDELVMLREARSQKRRKKSGEGYEEWRNRGWRNYNAERLREEETRFRIQARGRADAEKHAADVRRTRAGRHAYKAWPHEVAARLKKTEQDARQAADETRKRARHDAAAAVQARRRWRAEAAAAAPAAEAAGGGGGGGARGAGGGGGARGG